MIPGHRQLQIHHLVLDYNGTLAGNGKLFAGVKPRLASLADLVTVHVLTADTFGSAATELDGVPCTLTILPPQEQDSGKLSYVEQLGCAETVCIGNGRNDHAMVKAAALGIVVVQSEGAAIETLLDADVVAPTILDALDLLIYPRRLVATLRGEGPVLI